MISPPSRLIDFKLRVYTTLNQSRAIVLSKPHKPRGMCHVFPRPEVGHHQHHAPMSPPLIPHRLLYQPTCVDPSDCPSLTQPKLSDYMTHSRLPNRLLRISIHHLIIPS